MFNTAKKLKQEEQEHAYNDFEINQLLRKVCSYYPNTYLLTANWQVKDTFQEQFMQFHLQRIHNSQQSINENYHVIIPVNLGNIGNEGIHWAFLYIKYNSYFTKPSQAIYIDPLGYEMPTDISQLLSNKELFPNIKVGSNNTCLKQHSYNFGPSIIVATHFLLNNSKQDNTVSEKINYLVKFFLFLDINNVRNNYHLFLQNAINNIELPKHSLLEKMTSKPIPHYSEIKKTTLPNKHLELIPADENYSVNDMAVCLSALLHKFFIKKNDVVNPVLLKKEEECIVNFLNGSSIILKNSENKLNGELSLLGLLQPFESLSTLIIHIKSYIGQFFMAVIDLFYKHPHSKAKIIIPILQKFDPIDSAWQLLEIDFHNKNEIDILLNLTMCTRVEFEVLEKFIFSSLVEILNNNAPGYIGSTLRTIQRKKVFKINLNPDPIFPIGSSSTGSIILQRIERILNPTSTQVINTDCLRKKFLTDVYRLVENIHKMDRKKIDGFLAGHKILGVEISNSIRRKKLPKSKENYSTELDDIWYHTAIYNPDPRDMPQANLAYMGFPQFFNRVALALTDNEIPTTPSRILPPQSGDQIKFLKWNNNNDVATVPYTAIWLTDGYEYLVKFLLESTQLIENNLLSIKVDMPQFLKNFLEAFKAAYNPSLLPFTQAATDLLTKKKPPYENNVIQQYFKELPDATLMAMNKSINYYDVTKALKEFCNNYQDEAKSILGIADFSTLTSRQQTALLFNEFCKEKTRFNLGIEERKKICIDILTSSILNSYHALMQAKMDVLNIPGELYLIGEALIKPYDKNNKSEKISDRIEKIYEFINEIRKYLPSYQYIKFYTAVTCHLFSSLKYIPEIKIINNMTSSLSVNLLKFLTTIYDLKNTIGKTKPHDIEQHPIETLEISDLPQTEKPNIAPEPPISITENRTSLSTPERPNPLSGLRYYLISEDGNCLFNAISLHINYDANNLRNSVATYIQANISEFKEFYAGTEKNFMQHIDDINSGKEWGDAIEIEVSQRLLNRPIIIIRPDANPVIQGIEKYTGEPIFIYYNGHNHYNAFLLDRKSQYQAPQILENIQTAITRGERVIFPWNPPHEHATELQDISMELVQRHNLTLKNPDSGNDTLALTNLFVNAEGGDFKLMQTWLDPDSQTELSASSTSSTDLVNTTKTSLLLYPQKIAESKSSLEDTLLNIEQTTEYCNQSLLSCNSIGKIKLTIDTFYYRTDILLARLKILISDHENNIELNKMSDNLFKQFQQLIGIIQQTFSEKEKVVPDKPSLPQKIAKIMNIFT